MKTLKAELTQGQIDYLLQLLSDARQASWKCEENELLNNGCWSALTHAKES